MSEFASFRSKRKFGGFTAQVTVSESHADEVTFTDHPVEHGASISDHAYKNPATLTLIVGWSNSSSAAVGSAIGSILKGNIREALNSNYVADVYKRLLALQATREPFDVTTGKRKYRNMGISSLATETDEKSENVLIVTVGLREVIIVRTQSVNVPPREVQKQPEKTAETTDAGSKQAVPAKSANKTALNALVTGG